MSLAVLTKNHRPLGTSQDAVDCMKMDAYLVVASSMFAPGVPQVFEEFQSDNTILESMVVSVYVLGYACGPIVIVSNLIRLTLFDSF